MSLQGVKSACPSSTDVLQNAHAQSVGASAASAPDPALEAMLNQATAYLNALPAGSSDRQVWNDLLKEINYEISVGGQASAVRDWYVEYFNSQDPYMAYYKASPDTLQEEFNTIGFPGAMPKITPIDQNYRYARAYLDTLTPGSDDYTIINDMCQQMWNIGWAGTPAEFAQFSQWATKELDSEEYSMADPDVQWAFLYAGSFSLTVARYTTQQWLNLQLPGTPGWSLFKDMLGEINSLIVNGKDDGKGELNNWFQQQFGKQDLYMQYPTVNMDALKALWNIASDPSQPMPPPTAMDERYRAAINYRDSLPTEADYNLMNELAQQIFAAGSNPDSSDLAQLDEWAQGIVLDPNSDYYAADSTAQQIFLSNFDYSVSLACLQYYLENWEAAHPASYDQDFAATLNGIIQGYEQSQTDPTQLSKADFQNYLNEYYSDTDYCFMFPGLSPTDIASVYAGLGMTDPYSNYGPADTAYASANQAYSNLPDPTSGDDIAYNGDGSDANPGLFQLLCECQQGAISMNDVKNWIRQFEASQYWIQVSQETADVFNSILNM